MITQYWKWENEQKHYTILWAVSLLHQLMPSEINHAQPLP